MSSSELESLVRRERAHFMPGVRRWPLALERGHGSRVWDVDGREYLDLTAGWGVNAIGHCHPALVRAIEEQARTLIQTTNLVYTRPQIELAERLARIAPPGITRAFFTSSGTEANEGALKLACRHTGRGRFVATLGSFHGRTLGAMGALGQEKYRAQWREIVREAAFAPYGDLDAARALIDASVAAVIVEPIQGEGGVNVPPDGYLTGLARACREAGALLILDEIQTGMGRTGRWLALQHSGVQPDILTLGKGLGGGVPIGAFLATEPVMASVQPGDHGGTYAGNPLCCHAAAAVFDVIEREGLVERAARLGEQALGRLGAFAKAHEERVAEVRGRGLLIGLALRDAELAARAHARLRDDLGVLVNLTAERVLRLFPALNIPADDWDRGLDAIESAVEEA
jgi:predicted acetylornithine/succinylornithine family transaminase